MITVVSTDGLPAREREEYWRQAMSETFVPLTVGETAGETLARSIRSRWVGRLMTLLSGYAAGNAASRSSVQRSLLVKIKDHVDRRLADPSLGPTEIAAATGISRRCLHKLFAAERCSVSQYSEQRRPKRCRRDLLDPRLGEQSIAVITFGWGFGDLSGFNRAFKATFGMTPRDLRAGLGQHPDPACAGVRDLVLCVQDFGGMLETSWPGRGVKRQSGRPPAHESEATLADGRSAQLRGPEWPDRNFTRKQINEQKG